MDNFEDRLAAIEPAMALRVKNTLGEGGGETLPLTLRFKKMDDFGPAAVARQVPALARLLEARDQLANLTRYMDGKVAAEDHLKALLADPELMAALRDRVAQPEETEDDVAK
jgi:type VI secretion system protein ImpB